MMATLPPSLCVRVGCKGAATDEAMVQVLVVLLLVNVYQHMRIHFQSTYLMFMSLLYRSIEAI